MLIKMPRPVFMADISRAMNTPPPAAQQPQAPQPAAPPPRTPAGPGAAAYEADQEKKRDAKNERARLRRKAQRAAAVKAAALEAARPKKKKAKKKKLVRVHALTNAAVAPTKKAKRRRGRPPGAKNKPKAEGLAVALVPAPGVLPRAVAAPRSTDPFSVFLTLRDMLRALLPAQRIQVLAALVNDK